MTLDAKPHRMVDSTLGDSLFAHISVTFRAINAGLNMRTVIELHVSGGLETVDALPWYFLAAGLISGHFFNFGLVFRDYLMTRHTEIHARDTRIGSAIHSDVARDALHTAREVYFVSVSDGLNGLRPIAKKFLHGIPCRPVRGRKYSRVRCNRLAACGQTTNKQRQRPSNSRQRNQRTEPAAKRTPEQQRFTLSEARLNFES